MESDGSSCAINMIAFAKLSLNLVVDMDIVLAWCELHDILLFFALVSQGKRQITDALTVPSS